MSEFYYLDEKRQPQGPYSMEELRAMQAEGKLSAKTLIARKRDSAWVPLGEEGVAPPIPNSVSEWHCPRCGSSLELSAENQLPPRCTTCGYRLTPDKKGFWTWGMMGLRKSFTIKGRATRKEYWVSVLLWILLLFLGSVLMGLLSAWLDLHAESLVLLAVCYAFCCITLTTCVVRRLHDIGWSGKWILLSFVLAWFCAGAEIYYIGSSIIEEAKAELAVLEDDNATDNPQAEIGETQTATAEEEVKEPSFREMLVAEINKRQAVQEMFPLWLKLLLWGQQVLGLLLFIATLLDSQRGTNAYGPSPKYPRG